jgi:hypothetical protein
MRGVVYKNQVDALSTIWAKEGLTGFYRGWLANTLKVVPQNSIRYILCIADGPQHDLLCCLCGLHLCLRTYVYLDVARCRFVAYEAIKGLFGIKKSKTDT